MPPQNPYDPSTIDINLALLGEGSLQAVLNLTEKLDQVSQHLEQFSQIGPGGQVTPGRATVVGGVENSGVGPSTQNTGSGRRTMSDDAAGRGHDGVSPEGGGSRPPNISPEQWALYGQATGARRQRLEALYGELPGSAPGAGWGERASGTAEGEDPFSGEQRWREQQAAAQEREAQRRREGRGPRLEDMGGGQGRGIDPGDLPVRSQLANAWRATQGTPLRGEQPGYGRVGQLFDVFARSSTGGSEGTPGFGPPGGPSLGASQSHTVDLGGGHGGGGHMPPRDPDDPMAHVNPEVLRPSGFMPQEHGGVWTGRSYLQFASGHFARSYLRGVDRGEGAVGDADASGSQVWRARAANTLGLASQNYAQFHAYTDPARRYMQGVSQQYGGFRGNAQEATGEALGYERSNSNIGPNAFGFRVPGSQYFSEAGRAGMQSRAGRLELAAGAGINREQANEIYDQIESRGYGRGEADEIAFGSMARLTRQGQPVAGTAEFIDNAVRYNDAPNALDDITQAIDHLGNTAVRARRPIAQLQEEINASARAWGEQGATYTEGVRMARGWTDITGQDPNISNRVAGNPQVQSMAMMRYGITPGQMGALGPSALHGLDKKTMEMEMQMVSGFNRPLDIPIYDSHGKRTGTREVSGREMQMRRAAELRGEDYNTYRNRFRNAERNEAAGQLQEALHAYSRDTRGPGGKPIEGNFFKDPEGFRRATQRGERAWERYDVEGLMKKSGVDKDEIERIKKLPVNRRRAAAQEALEERGRTNEQKGKQTVLVKFTGKAEKLFEQVTSGSMKDKKDVAGGLLNSPALYVIPGGPGLKQIAGLF